MREFQSSALDPEMDFEDLIRIHHNGDDRTVALLDERFKVTLREDKCAYERFMQALDQSHGFRLFDSLVAQKKHQQKMMPEIVECDRPEVRECMTYRYLRKMIRTMGTEMLRLLHTHPAGIVEESISELDQLYDKAKQ